MKRLSHPCSRTELLRLIEPAAAPGAAPDYLDELLRFYWRYREVIGWRTVHLRHASPGADPQHWVTLIRIQADHPDVQPGSGTDFEHRMLTVAALAIAALDASRGHLMLGTTTRPTDLLTKDLL